MVSYNQKTASAAAESESAKYRGVRKRNWGKWVSEIRLPNSRERIWLGSYDSAEKAARAFDAALFCLRGPNAKFNLPNCPPDIPGGMSLSRSQIQSAAAEYANQLQSSYSSSCSESQLTTTTTTFDELDCSSSSVSINDSFMFSDTFLSGSDLDVSVSDYGFFDELDFGAYSYGGAASDHHQSQVVQEVEDYPQLWNF